MPFAHVYYRLGVLDERMHDGRLGVFQSLRIAVSTAGASHLSSTEYQLQPSYFTVLFHESGPHDVMTHDIMVVYDLHEFQDRVDNAQRNASLLAHACRAVLLGFLEGKDVTINVTLQLFKMEWYTVNIRAND